MQNNEKHYNDVSSGYDKQRTGKYFTLINDLEFDTLEPFIKNRKVLEIGCGTGLILEKTKKAAVEAQGIDISEGMLDFARQRGLSVQLADAKNIPFPDGYFDVVYSFKVLPHIEEIEGVLKEISRITKPGGRAVLEFYNPMSTKKISNMIIKPGNFTRYDSLSKIKKILPDDLIFESYRGIRSIMLFGFMMKIPVLNSIIRDIESRFSRGFLGRFGGYFIVILRKS